MTLPNYNVWLHRRATGDPALINHIDSMERGDEGHFVQALLKAMGKADHTNGYKLYSAFPDYFNPF